MKMTSIVAVGSDGRVSTLVLEDNGTLRVLGNLPHGYKFKPATREDAITLAAHILAPFDDGQHG